MRLSTSINWDSHSSTMTERSCDKPPHYYLYEAYMLLFCYEDSKLEWGTEEQFFFVLSLDISGILYVGCFKVRYNFLRCIFVICQFLETFSCIIDRKECQHIQTSYFNAKFIISVMLMFETELTNFSVNVLAKMEKTG